MKISSMKVKITENDIKGIIDEYLHIEELKIEDIKINQFITIYGEYNKNFNVKFKIQVGIGRVYNNEIKLKIFKIRIGKVPVPIGVVSSIIKHYVKKLNDIGVVIKKGYIKLKVDLLMKFVPYAYLKLKNLTLMDGEVEAEAEDVIISQNKKEEKLEIRSKKISNQESINVKDGYTDLRNNIVSKVPKKYDAIIQYAMLIPDLTSLLCRLIKDKRVNMKIKIVLGVTITYLVSPVDILPDVIPFIGKIDDISVAFLVLDKIIKQIPENIIKDNWEGQEDIIVKIRQGAKYICEVIGSRNVSKIFAFIKQRTKNKKISKNK